MRLGASIIVILALAFSIPCIASEAPSADCSIHEGACVKELEGMRVIFDATPKPVRSMSELRFTVTVEGMKGAPEFLVLDLSMPGMTMGRNRVKLFKSGDGRYEGVGVIVKCPSGRTLWRATVLSGDKTIADFMFNVGNRPQ